MSDASPREISAFGPVRPPASAVIGLGLGLALAACAGALGAPAPTVDRAERVTLALDGQTLAIAESGAVKTPTFTYYRARISTVKLTRNRFGFAAKVERKMIFRTSIGPMNRPLLAVNSTGSLIASASGKSFAGPVVWCCSAEDEEQVMYSNGRADALRPRAVAFDGQIARALIAGGSSGAILERLETSAVQREDFQLLEPLFALGSTTVAENHTGFVLTPRISTREGPIARAVPGFAGPPPPGKVTRLWTDRDRVVALVQRGGRWEIYRYLNNGTRRLMLRSSRRPAEVAVGGGSIVASIGRTIWAGRGNRKLTPQRLAGGRIRALAVDGTRVAWLEQRGQAQRTRLGRVR